MFLNRVAVRVLSGKLRGREFAKLRESLKQARMRVPPEEHASLAVFYSPIFASVGAILGYLISGLVGIPAFYLAILFCFLFGFGFFQIFMHYPVFAAKNRVPKIDAALPSAVTFMYALSKGGVDVIENFKHVQREKEEFKEIGKEAAEIVRNVEYFGQSPPAAIKNVATSTPSSKFRNFLELLVPIVETGADVSEYFSRKSKQYYDDAKIQQTSYLESLGMLAEIYVMVLGLLPLLLIVALIMLSMAGAFYVEFLYLIIYLIIPFGTLMCLVLLDAITRTPAEERSIRYGPRVEEVFEAESPEEEEIAKKLSRGRFRLIAASPIRYLRRRPIDVLLITVPLSLLFLAVCFFYGSFSASTVVFATLIAFVPFVIFYEIRSRWAGRVIDALPDFLTGLSGGIASGLTLRQSLDTMSMPDLGPLGDEVKKVKSDVSWGRSTLEALMKFQQRIKIGIVTRISTLIKKASEARGRISDVLDIMAADVMMTKSLRRERKTAMSTYMIIIYLSFGMFLVMSYVLASHFLPLIAAKAVAEAPMMPGLGGFNIDPLTIKTLFFHGALIYGFCSGLVAGQMGSGHVLAGLKHSLIMLVVAYLVFTLALGV